MRRSKLAGHPSLLLLASTAAVLVALTGCGGPPPVAHAGMAAADAPPPIDDASVHEVERVFWRMAPEDPARVAWRDGLIAYRSGRTEGVMRRGDYEEIVRHLSALTALLTPADVAEGRVPAELGPLARWVVEQGSLRGDEGRVMGALVLLAALEDDPEGRRAEHERIERWGREAREGVSNPLDRFGGLIQVWEQHEELAPTPEVLATLARLYVEQRDGLLAVFGPEGQGSRVSGRISMRDLQTAPLLVQRAPLDVAAVFLRHGDLERAAEHVRRMGALGSSGMEVQLVRILERAQQRDAAGAQALEEVARGFARARPAIAAAICRLGARRFPSDARFPICLARVASEGNEVGEATAWYADAVRLSPDDREVYDEALGRLASLLEEGQLESNLPQSRAVARHALEILEERTRRWPQAAASVTREQLLTSIARAEMGRGHVREARERLEAALAARETREAHHALGLLLERTGDARGAADHYRRALDLTEQRGAEGTAGRAELLERLGDAFRLSSEEPQAARMYRQALGLWDELARQVRGARGALVHVRRGILLSRLGDHRGSDEAFDAAMDAAPTWREPYAAILSHLVVSTPNLELAQRVLRRAQHQLTLERQWKVYFALWVQVIAQRASASLDREITMVFDDEARGDSWSARLAAFGAGQLDYDGLLAAAHERGEQAEAQFYQAARLLGSGDAAGARRLLEAVLQSGMVNFYEYAMAQELLAAAGAAPQVASEARR